MTPKRLAWIGAVAAVGAVALVAARRRARSGEPRGRLRSSWTEVEGVPVHARVSARPASGTLPVVLVHGYGMSGSYMVPLARRLAAEFPVYVPDLPGHGRSGKPERPLGIPGLAEALQAWMEAVGLRRAAFVGNSMGCQIVAELAARHPETVDRLILVGPVTDPETRTVRQHLPRFLKTAFAERLSLAALMIADFFRAGPRRLADEARFMFQDPIERKLPEIDTPALVVRGEKDSVVPQRWAEEVAGRLGTDRLLVIPGEGHALNYSAAGELLRRIRPFLRCSFLP